MAASRGLVLAFVCAVAFGAYAAPPAQDVNVVNKTVKIFDGIVGSVPQTIDVSSAKDLRIIAIVETAVGPPGYGCSVLIFSQYGASPSEAIGLGSITSWPSTPGTAVLELPGQLLRLESQLCPLRVIVYARGN